MNIKTAEILAKSTAKNPLSDTLAAGRKTGSFYQKKSVKILIQIS